MLPELFNLLNCDDKKCDFKRHFLFLYFFHFFEIIIKQFSLYLSSLEILPYTPPHSVSNSFFL